MSRGISITGRRGVQAVALGFAGALGFGAYFFATTGWGTPFPGCWPPLSRPAALAAAAVLAALAAGFLLAALRKPDGPELDDSLLIALVLGLFAALALGGGLHTLSTGVARWGKSGCLSVGAPWSYGLATASLLVGGLALLAAAAVAARRGD